jgi:hypothetical protein
MEPNVGIRLGSKQGRTLRITLVYIGNFNLAFFCWGLLAHFLFYFILFYFLFPFSIYVYSFVLKGTNSQQLSKWLFFFLAHKSISSLPQFHFTFFFYDQKMLTQKLQFSKDSIEICFDVFYWGCFALVLTWKIRFWPIKKIFHGKTKRPKCPKFWKKYN